MPDAILWRVVGLQFGLQILSRRSTPHAKARGSCRRETRSVSIGLSKGDSTTRMSWRCAGAITRYQEGSERISARHLEIFCRLVAISPPTLDQDVIKSPSASLPVGKGQLTRVGPSNAYRYLYRGTAASPALAGCFHHQGLSNFIAGRLASRLRVRHTHDELVWRLRSIFDLGFRWQPRWESREGQHPGRHPSPLVSPSTSLNVEGVAGG